MHSFRITQQGQVHNVAVERCGEPEPVPPPGAAPGGGVEESKTLLVIA
ncbi:MAG: hypothetical protein ACOZE5_03475 [Verrucomicrobiota bacterium]